MTGNIDIQSNGEHSLSFDDRAKMIGNLKLIKGTSHVTFNNKSKIIGNLALGESESHVSFTKGALMQGDFEIGNNSKLGDHIVVFDDSHFIGSATYKNTSTNQTDINNFVFDNKAKWTVTKNSKVMKLYLSNTHKNIYENLNDYDFNLDLSSAPRATTQDPAAQAAAQTQTAVNRDLRVLEVGTLNSQNGQVLLGTQIDTEQQNKSKSDKIKTSVLSSGTLYVTAKDAVLKSGSFSTEGEEAIVLVTADTAYGKVQGTERKQGLSYVVTTLEHQVAATSTDTNWTKVEDEEETNNSTNTNQTHRWVLAAFDTRVNQELVDESGFIISNPYRMLLIESNNLNKRMGDLRDNPYAQGSWIRVFNGMDGGKGVENRYTNIQLGYDYAFGLVGAKSYTGLALSTSIVDVKGNQYSGKANTYSLALYNSYIADNGWYVDAIAKYLYTDQKMTPSGTSRETQFGNHAYSLGLEVGHKEYIQDSNFFIESQLELIAGLVQGVDHIYAGRVGGLDIYGNLRTTPGLSTREGIVTGYTLKTQNNKFQADFRLGLSLVQEFVSN